MLLLFCINCFYSDLFCAIYSKDPIKQAARLTAIFQVFFRWITLNRACLLNSASSLSGFFKNMLACSLNTDYSSNRVLRVDY